MDRDKKKKKDKNYKKSEAKSLSIPKAMESSPLKMLRMKEEKERDDEKEESSINSYTAINSQHDQVEPVAIDEQIANEIERIAEEDENELTAWTYDAEEEPIVKKRSHFTVERINLPPIWATKRRKAMDDSLPNCSTSPKQIPSSAKEGSTSEAVNPEVDAPRYFAGKKIGFRYAALRCHLPRAPKAHPSILAKRINTEEVKLNMRKSVDAKKIVHRKSINRNWKEVRYWNVSRQTRVDDNVSRLMYQEKAIEFSPVVPEGTVLSEFNPTYAPINVFLQMLGGCNTLDFLLEATNNYIRSSWRYDLKGRPPSRKIGGKPEGKKKPEMPTDGLVTRHELCAFLGIQFLIGYHRLPELSMFWERQPDSGFGLGIVQQAMTRERFKFISKHIACVNPVESDDEEGLTVRRDSIQKIQPLVDILNVRFNACRKPPRWQSIDESMVKYKGRSMLRQTLKGKTIKRGFKIWSRCCIQGYTYMLGIYRGSQLGATQTNRNNEVVERVVLDLCRTITEQGHVVAFDQFFTSINLLDKLNRKGINAVGTILPSRLNQPIMKKNESNLKPGEFVAKFGGEPGTCRKGLFIWRDIKSFRLVSNFHGSEIVEVKTKQRDGSFRKKTYPKAIAEYVDNMGGVDTANQLRCFYERDRKSKRWWHRLFYSLMETCLVNSWICFCDLTKEDELTQEKFLKNESCMDLLQFKRRVTLGLLTYGLNSEKFQAGQEGRLMPSLCPLPIPGPKRRKNRLSVRDELRFSAVGLHLPIFGETRGRCEWCQATTECKRESRPFSRCTQCKVFLCLSKKRNCFVEYHGGSSLQNEKDPLQAAEAVCSSGYCNYEAVEKDCLAIFTLSDKSDFELDDCTR